MIIVGSEPVLKCIDNKVETQVEIEIDSAASIRTSGSYTYANPLSQEFSSKNNYFAIAEEFFNAAVKNLAGIIQVELFSDTRLRQMNKMFIYFIKCHIQ